MEADRVDIAVLAGAKQFAGAADLHIAHGDGISRSKLGVLGDHLQALLTVRCGCPGAVPEEVSISTLGAASDPAAQLVKLCQPECIGAVHDQRVRIGDIQPRFDDGSAQQYIDLVMGEAVHHLRQFVLLHLAVPDAVPGFRDEFLQVHEHRGDAVDAVVKEEHLSTPLQLAQDRLAH